MNPDTGTSAPAAPNEQQELSIREELSTAFDAVEAPPAEAPPEAPPAEEAPQAAEAPEGATQQPSEDKGQPRDAQGRFKKPAAEEGTQQQAPPEQPSSQEAPQPEAVPQPGAPEPDAKAPASWKPLAREVWAQVPKEAKAEIIRREKEVARTLEETAQARQGFDAVRQTIQPYMAMIQSEGVTPLQAINNLLGFSYQLRTSPSPQKAQLIAGMIKQFLPSQADLEMLNDAIMAQGGATEGASSQPMQDPRVDQILQKLNAAEQKAQANVRNRYLSEIQKFAESHEFFPYVQDDMAVIMDAAHARGMDMDFERAYVVACKAHPEVSEVLARRDAAEKARKSAASTQRSREAASTVRSNPAGVRTAPQPEDLRSDIERAVDEVSGRMR